MAAVGVELWLLAYSGAGGTSSEEEKGAGARDWRRSLRQGSSFGGSGGTGVGGDSGGTGLLQRSENDGHRATALAS